MKALTKEQAKVIGALVLNISIGQTCAAEELITKGNKFFYWTNYHDNAVQALRDLGITKECGPSKYNEKG